MSKLRMGRNFSLNEKKIQNFNFPDSSKTKENVNPYQTQERNQGSLNLNELQISTKRSTVNMN